MKHLSGCNFPTATDAALPSKQQQAQRGKARSSAVTPHCLSTPEIKLIAQFSQIYSFSDESFQADVPDSFAPSLASSDSPGRGCPLQLMRSSESHPVRGHCDRKTVFEVAIDPACRCCIVQRCYLDWCDTA